jgi:hypothetical protein
MPNYKSLSFSFGIGFFFKNRKYFAFIVEKNEEKKNNEFSTKFFKLPNGPRFN